MDANGKIEWISWHVVSVNADFAHARWCCCRYGNHQRCQCKSSENCFQSMLNQIQTTIPLLPIVLQFQRLVLAYSMSSFGFNFFFTVVAALDDTRYFVCFVLWRLSASRCSSLLYVPIINLENHTFAPSPHIRNTTEIAEQNFSTEKNGNKQQ